MLKLSCFESRLAELQRLHPEMPVQAVSMVRFIIFLQRRLEDELAGILAQHDLSHSGWSLLMMIYSAPRQTINPSTASDVLGQSRPHMTRMTDELCARGWVERTQDPNDRRAVEICLTAKGAAAMQEILPPMWRQYEGLSGRFSAEEIDLFSGFLRRWLLDLETATHPDNPPAAPAKDIA